MESRVISIRLIESEEFLGNLYTLLHVFLLIQAVPPISNLTFTLSNVCWRLTDGIIYLMIKGI